MYDSIIEAVIDAYEGEDPWEFKDKVLRTVEEGESK